MGVQSLSGYFGEEVISVREGLVGKPLRQRGVDLLAADLDVGDPEPAVLATPDPEVWQALRCRPEGQEDQAETDPVDPIQIKGAPKACARFDHTTVVVMASAKGRWA